jgi:hypothetical protein
MCNPIAMHNPDAVLAKGEHAGFEYEVIHNGHGIRCGYVRVPFGHAWHGVPYDDLDVEVHGGLTFAEPDEPCPKDGPDNAYWVGFDTHHLHDAQDWDLPWAGGDEVRQKIRQIHEEVGLDKWPHHVWTTEEVEAECRSVCEQAARA